MQKQESRKSNLDLPVSRIRESHSMIGKPRMILAVLSLLTAFMVTTASAQAANDNKPEQSAVPAAAPKVINIWPGVAPGSEN